MLHKISHLVFFTFFVITVHAQNFRVVKDNIACLYGIKNTEGEWVIPAEYTIIHDIGDYFTAMKNEMVGIYNDEANLIIPVAYDKIEFTGRKSDRTNPPDYFILTKDSLSGLADSTGEIILGRDYKEIKQDGNGKFSLQATDGKFGYYSHQGTLIPAIYNSALTFYYSQLSRFIRTDKKKTRFGIINKSGKEIFTSEKEFKYQILYNYFFTIHKNKICVFDSTGKLLIDSTEAQGFYPTRNYFVFCKNDEIKILHQDMTPVLDEWTQFLVRGEELRQRLDFIENDTLIARQGKFWGLMKGNGIWIGEHDYETLNNWNHPETNYKWYGKRNGKYCFLNKKGERMVETGYTEMREMFYSSNYYFGVTTHDKKHGVIDANLNILLPCSFQSTDSYGQHYFYISSDSIVDFYLYEKERGSQYDYNIFYEPRIEKLNLFVSVAGKIDIYKNKYGKYFEFSKPNNNRPFPEFNSDVRISEDRFVIVYYDGQTYKFDYSGKPVKDPLENYADLVDYYGDYICYTHNGMCGVVNDTGKLIIDTIYYEIRSNGNDLLFAKTSDQHKTYGNNFLNEVYSWKLIDEKGKAVSNYIFDGAFREQWQNKGIVTCQGKTGLFDYNLRKFIIQPVYDYILPGGYDAYLTNPYTTSSPEIFIVKTGGGKFGVINVKGKQIVDTTFESVMYVPHRGAGWYNLKKSVLSTERYLLCNSSQKIMVDAAGKTEKNPQRIDTLLAQCLSEQYTGTHHHTPSYQPGYHVQLPAYTHYKDSAILFPSLVFMANYASEHFQHLFSWTKKDMNLFSAYHYFWMNYIDAKICVFSYSKPLWKIPENNSSNDLQCYFNILKNGDKLEIITLESIFSNTDSIPVIMNELIVEAIKSNDHLNLDCTNNDLWFSMMKNRFFVNEKGLNVMISRNQAYADNVFMLTIPWEKIVPFAKQGSVVYHFKRI